MLYYSREGSKCTILEDLQHQNAPYTHIKDAFLCLLGSKYADLKANTAEYL